MSERSSALDRFVLELTEKPIPRICFLPTASGDTREQVIRFHERFGDWPCEPSTLSLFRLSHERIDPVKHLLSQDAIYVGGGSMRNMLAVWREHGVDLAMRQAWQQGTVLAGLSAGAMCWFEFGLSKSAGPPEVVTGLGLLKGSLSVHRDGEPDRLSAYRAAVQDGQLPAGWAADDCAALLLEGGQLTECVASRRGAGVAWIASDEERELSVRLLADPGLPSTEPDGEAVSELRSLRTGRQRWD
jgi:peptidase E